MNYLSIFTFFFALGFAGYHRCHLGGFRGSLCLLYVSKTTVLSFARDWYDVAMRLAHDREVNGHANGH